MTFGTLGVGQIPYWGAVLFNAMAGIDALEIQYKNPADAVTDVITGRIDYYIAPPVVAIGSKDKLRMLAVTTRVRSEVLPRRADDCGNGAARLRHAGPGKASWARPG